MQVGCERPGRVRTAPLEGTDGPGAARFDRRWLASVRAFAPRPMAAVRSASTRFRSAVEYQVRDARLTDVGRISALMAASSVMPAAAGTAGGGTDLLRQLVYLPNAAVLVADARRVIVGATVLALRPSVRAGGMVGTVDLLVVDPAYVGAGVATSLLGEALRSARNKGCVAVEAVPPGDPADLQRWTDLGFTDDGPRILRDLAPEGAARE
jgi:GNAT superfamily N-acetyltransferase